MSKYKENLISRLGLMVVAFNMDDLKLAKGEELPEYLKGETIYLQKLSGRQFEDFAAGHAGLADDDGSLASEKFRGIRAELVCLCHRDPEGNPLWKDKEEVNEALANESLGALFLACQQVNGMGRKADEVAQKN